MVATGVGLTPMLSLIDKYSDKKECHILWTTRDRHMVKHFNAMLRKCHSTVWFTNKDINAKQQFEQLQDTLNSTLKLEIDSAATASTNTSYHSSSQDLNNIESGGTTSTTHVTNSSNGSNKSNDTSIHISSERDRVSADIVTLLEQGWPTHWNRQLTKTPTNGTRRSTTKQVDLRLGRPDLVHEVLHTVEVNSGIALTSTTLSMDQTGRGDRSNSNNSNNSTNNNNKQQLQRSLSSFFTMNLSNSSSNGRAVAHCNDDDDITGADDVIDCDTTVNSYDRQSSELPSTAVTAGNGSTGSASATSNSSRSERQGSGDTVATANTTTLSVDSRVIANSDDLFRKYDGLQDILASNDNLRKKIEKHVITAESDRWAVLYCGTSEHVADTLKQACKTAGVAFRWEYFGEW
eukprot:16424-Heterococcus_DN1.PRE.2